MLFLCGCNFQHRFFEMPLPCEHSKDVLCSPVIHEVSTAGNYYIEYARVPNNYTIYFFITKSLWLKFAEVNRG